MGGGELARRHDPAAGQEAIAHGPADAAEQFLGR
jgi:hypothetical protein